MPTSPKPPTEDDGFTVSAAQWAALAVTVTRDDGQATTYITRGTPNGDSAITAKTAAALYRRGWITVVPNLEPPRCAPTPGGRRALEVHNKLLARRTTTP